MSSIPCYSDVLPPECGSLVVVKCNRVDEHGVWGPVTGWGSNCTAYIPIGFVVAKRGRGERRAQADFLTRTKRQAAKGKPITVVARVESIEVTSSKGVDEVSISGKQMCENYLLTLTRRGLEKVEEKAAMEALKLTQNCAAHLVDKAASKTGVPQEWAREICLYQPYRRAVKGVFEKAEETREAPDPSVAAAKLLVNCIGSLEEYDERAVYQLLQPSEVSSGWETFAETIRRLCRDERLRTAKPVTVSLSASLGGLSGILGGETDASAIQDNAADISRLNAAISAARDLAPLAACSELSVRFEGSGRYTFSTQAPPEIKESAEELLRNAIMKAKEQYFRRSIFAQNTPAIQSKESPSTPSHVQPSLIIGLIGDVANGKSTLIRAITGKRTQAHSSEQQKHGMTIRLGFANASVLRCRKDGCGLYCFRQDEAKPAPTGQICSFCQSEAEVVTRVSFIDCPGHAELMATMLSGSSAFDAVVFAAAANMPCPSPQAQQHLEALRMSGIRGRMAIVQTKAELIAQGATAEEKLLLHAENAKEKLVGTTAEGAPIFPVCSPMGLGLEPLAAWMAQVSGSSTLRKDGGNSFKVLRSFDVNFAGTDAAKMVGGVLGGTINGSGSFKPGDAVEVRPGIVTSNGEGEFSSHPIRFTIKELMTDKTSLAEAKAGGLVAVKTTLDPALCAENGLVGSVVGVPGMLPPVFGPTLLLNELKLVDKKALKKDTKIRLHAGPATVTGKVVRVSSKRQKVELCLDRPVCAFSRSRVAIEAAGIGLVAHGVIADGTVCLEGAEPEDDESAEDADHDSPSKADDNTEILEQEARQRFLDDLAATKSTSDGQEMISIPSPSVVKDGGSHVLVENFCALAVALNREPSHLQAYLAREGGLACARAGEGGLRVRYRARGFSELVRRILRRYAMEYVTCHQCKSAKTEFLKGSSGGGNQTELLCRQCNARRFVTKLA